MHDTSLRTGASVNKHYRASNETRLAEISIFKNDYTLFVLSLILFLIGVFLFNIISPKYAQLVQIVSIPLLLYSGYKTFSPRIANKYLSYVFSAYMLSNIAVLSRMEDSSYDQIKIFLFSDFAFWPYLIPLVVLIKRTPLFFNVLFFWIIRLAIAFFIVSALLWNRYQSTEIIAEQAIWLFSSGCGFILLTSKYHNATRKLIALCAVVLALYLSTLLARRNLMLTNINFLLFTFILYFFFLKGHVSAKLISVYACVILLFAGFLFFKSKVDTDFRAIVNRASDDTREYVFYNYFADMQQDMWLGKGVDGTYFCPLVTEDEGFIYRYIIECGYLQIILKGGLLNLILFLMLLIPAMVLGIFYSNNIFSKACGMLIFLWLVDMFPYGLPSFSIRYILVWICVGVCFDKHIRRISENEMFTLLTTK